MSNRVEELEAKVTELQAAVDGLTEELVETRERLRQLESENEVDVAPASSSSPSGTAAGDASGGDAEEAKTTEQERADDEETSEVEDDDIIVA